MKFRGTYTDLDEDWVVEEYGDELSQVVVRKDRIAFDWIEDDEHFGATLYPRELDSQCYFGNITAREEPNIEGYISAYRFDLKGGDVLILAKWYFGDKRGLCTFELHREVGEA